MRPPLSHYTGFRMPLYPIAPVLFVLAEFAIVVNTFYRYPRNSALGPLLILTGVPVFFYWRRHAILHDATPQR